MKRRTIRVERPGPIRDVVAAELGRTVEEADRLIEAGAVYLQGKRCLTSSTAAQPGQVVMVVLEESGRAADAPAASRPSLRVLFEDASIVAVDKPAGITAQPTPSRVGESLLDVVSAYLGRPAGLVHRLDRQTSGVTVFGKTSDATRSLAAAFREGGVRKRYLAVAAGTVPERGEIHLPLSRDPSRVGRWRASAQANGIAASTRYERLHAGNGFALVALFPATGRTHQLRAHLRGIGAPIAGDALYEGPATLAGIDAPRCLLHAQALALPGRSLIEAPVPDDLAIFFALANVRAPSGPW